jgi:Asp-tRNA(Asn)/Glu-tRNA(Gln) amidotransferase A subunit family amidase
MPPLDDYLAHDALALAALVAKRSVSPEELLDLAQARLEAVNPKLNAVVLPMQDEARAALRAGLPQSPLRGVPFLLKDLHSLYAGSRTTHGSRFFRDFVADHDTEIVARYRRAGLVIFGRTASPEFGLTTTTESLLFGVTRNPWSLEHTTGGSSGGAAAAVAAGIVPAANATDGGGSIRIPASCCGLFGLKPTRARVPSGPDVGEGWSGMSAMHAVSRSVRDSAALLDATAGPAPGDPYFAPPPARPFLHEVGAPPGRLRIALQTRSWTGVATHPDCAAAAVEAAKLCAELGHDVEEAALSVDAEVLRRHTVVIIAANVRATLDDRAAVLRRPVTQDDVEPVTWFMAQAAASQTAADYARAIRGIHAAGRQVESFFQDHDVLLTPTLATPPMKLGALALTNDLQTFLENVAPTTAFTQLFNVSGHPAASVPLHWNAEGLPIGVQITARFGDEATLFRLAAQLEAARPWFHRRPPLLA